MPRFTIEEMRLARKADLYKFLTSHHADLFDVISKNLRFKANKSISIKPSYCGFLDFSSGDKGNSVDFLTKYLGYRVDEAVYALLNLSDHGSTVEGSQTVSEGSQTASEGLQVVSMVLPAKNVNNERLRAYLNGRCISYETIDMLIEKNVLYEDINHNCVFVNSACDWGEVRGTSKKPFHGILKNSRQDGFWWFEYKTDEDKKAKAVFICESSIDAISLYEIYRITGKLKFNCVFVSIGGVAKQQTIDRLIKAKKPIIITVDNDTAGSQCRNRNSSYKSFIPKLKDWNEDLKAILERRKKNEVET